MQSDGGRALTGAWIETEFRAVTKFRDLGRALTGAWIETGRHYVLVGIGSRALTGAWIETRHRPDRNKSLDGSRPHGRVD